MAKKRWFNCTTGDDLFVVKETFLILVQLTLVMRKKSFKQLLLHVEIHWLRSLSVWSGIHPEYILEHVQLGVVRRKNGFMWLGKTMNFGLTNNLKIRRIAEGGWID